MIEQYLDRLAFQFADSDNLKGLLTAHLLDYEDLDISLDDLAIYRYLDTAKGVQLDGIGEIVGLERPVKPIDLIGAFGFVDDDTSQGFGTLINTDIGGNFVSLNSLAQPIGNELYRTLLRVKIKVNQTAMTNEDVIDIISFAFGDILVRYILFINTKPTYEIGKILTQFEIDVILPLIPVMIGIDEADYKLMHNETPFGFFGDETALGFGSIGGLLPSSTLLPSTTLLPSSTSSTNSSIGGNFATLI